MIILNDKVITLGGKSIELDTPPQDPYFYPFDFSTEGTKSYRKQDWHGNVFTSTVNATWHSFLLTASHTGTTIMYVYDFAAEFTKTGDIFDGQLPYLGTQIKDQWFNVVVGENTFVIDLPISGSTETPKHYWMGLRTINVGTLADDGILRSLDVSSPMPFDPVNGIQLRDTRNGSTNYDYYAQGLGYNFYYFYDSAFILT